MRQSPLVIHDNSGFRRHLLDLKAGDIVASRLSLQPQEEHTLLDLVERGVRLIPSATSQLASRSKTFQTHILSSFMLPGTTNIYTPQTLLELIGPFQERGYQKVIIKHDRKNAGQGVFLFNSIEEAYTLTANNCLPLPFVLQPYEGNSTDIRVVVLADYVEAYRRSNPHNFRNNLYCGGSAEPCTLTSTQMRLCEDIMKRGGFPYAHLDLMETDGGETFLLEINLRGGLKGAVITTEEYKERVRQIQYSLVESMLAAS